jgi:uncharacterized protein (TIGR03066 family)
MYARLCDALMSLLVFAGGLPAEYKKGDEKIDAKKLVGRWENVEFKEVGVSKTAEFAKDGKAVFTDTDAKGNETKVEGTYRIDGNKLVVTVTLKGKERQVTTTISKLTDAEMVGTDEKGFEGTWVRVKDK